MAITINGTGSITGLTAGGLPDGSITTDDLAANAVTAAKLAAGAGGKILQVVQAVKTDTNSFSASTNTWFDIGLSATITPSSASSKILIFWNTSISNSATSGQRGGLRINRDGTILAVGDAAGSRIRAAHGSVSFYVKATGGVFCQQYLDSPATISSINYKIQAHWETSAGTVYVNRGGDDTDDGTQTRGASVLTLMEVQG